MESHKILESHHLQGLRVQARLFITDLTDLPLVGRMPQQGALELQQERVTSYVHPPSLPLTQC